MVVKSNLAKRSTQSYFSVCFLPCQVISSWFRHYCNNSCCELWLELPSKMADKEVFHLSCKTLFVFSINGFCWIQWILTNCKSSTGDSSYLTTNFRCNLWFGICSMWWIAIDIKPEAVIQMLLWLLPLVMYMLPTKPVLDFVIHWIWWI